MFFQKINPAAMKRQRRRIRQGEAVADVCLEDVMFGRGIAAVGFEHDIDRSNPGALPVHDSGAASEQEVCTGGAERISGAGEASVGWLRISHHIVEHACRVDLPCNVWPSGRAHERGRLRRVLAGYGQLGRGRDWQRNSWADPSYIAVSPVPFHEAEADV